MTNSQDDNQTKLNKLLGRQGSIAERTGIARELDDDALQLAAPYSPQAKEELERRRHARLLAPSKKCKTVTFVGQEYLPIARDGLDLRVDFTVVDSHLRGEPEEMSSTTKGLMIVGISRTLASAWHLEPAARDKVLLEFAKRHIRAKVQDGALTEREELQLTTGDTPIPCPFDPDRISVKIGQPMEFPLEENDPVQAAEPAAMASRIVDFRDNVNAIFHEQYGEDLLKLPQERALLELFRPCRSAEEFGYRVSALAGMGGAINDAVLKKHLPPESAATRPIQALRAYVAQKQDAVAASNVCDTLGHLNRMRQMYPIHTGDAGGVIEAHRFFGLDYPVRDWPRAWAKLLEAYAQALDALLRAVKDS